MNKKNQAAKETTRRTRRVLDETFKTKVVLEAIKESMTLHELASKYDVHPNQVSQWKAHFLKNAVSVFSGPKDEIRELEQLRTEREELHKRIVEKDMDSEFLKKLEETEPAVRVAMVDPKGKMPIIKQCVLLGIKRRRVYHKKRISAKKLEIMNRIDELYTEDPTRGQRRMRHALRKQFSLIAGRNRIRKLMDLLGITSSTKNIQTCFGMLPLQESTKSGVLISHTFASRAGLCI